MERVTLRTIAKEAGVSIAAVSMALRGQGKLAKENVENIRAVAERLGYIPDPTLASLATRRFRVGGASKGSPLALLEFPPHKGEFTNAVSAYREHLKTFASGLGYSPCVYPLDVMKDYHDFTRILYHRGTVAVIVTGQLDPHFFGERERWRPFVLAHCGRYRSDSPFHTVRPNIFQAIKLAFEKAYERGYRRIAFAIGRHEEILEDDLARYGAATALIQTYLPAKARIKPYFENLHDYKKMVRWVEKQQPEVVIGFNNVLWYYLKDSGILAPRDLGFISLHVHPEDKDNISISGLNQSRQEIARQTILLIDQMVRHNERSMPEQPRNILIPSVWHEGETLGS